MKWLTLAIFLVGCGASGPHRVVDTSSVQGQGVSSMPFADVKPLFAKHCSECHPVRSNPDWLDLKQAKPFALNGVLVRRVFTEKSMPPPGSPQAAAMPDADRQKIAEWAKSFGAKSSAAGDLNSQSLTQTSVDAGAAGQCLQCHGPSTPSSDGQPKIPILAGQNIAYISLQLTRFKWRERIDPGVTMNDIAGKLSVSEILETAKYFSERKGLTFTRPPDPRADSRESFLHGQKIAARNCVSCHMNASSDNRPDNFLIPVLTGQSKQYLLYQLLYFRDQERRSPLMYEYVRSLTNQQVEDLATYFSQR